MLTVDFSRHTQKFLKKAEKILAARLFEAASELGNDPFPHGVKRVENQVVEGEKVFRIRIGAYRILYAVNPEKKRVLIVNIDKRQRVYD